MKQVTENPSELSGQPYNSVNSANIAANPVFVPEKTFSNDQPIYNNDDKPGKYVGKRRKKEPGDDTRLNIESDNPCVFLVIEKVEGLGESTIAASMSFKTAVAAAKKFAEPIEGEIFPERAYLPSAGPVRMRKADNTVTPYTIIPMYLE